MIDRFSIQMQAMQMLSRAQEITADNLANINTPGFKGSSLFYRIYNENMNGVVTQKTMPVQQINLQQGELEHTGNAFDLGISGSGFFVVEADNQLLLTRDGRFTVDTDGYLVNSSGARVMGAGGAVNMPEYFQAADLHGRESTIEIAKDGTIRINDQIHDKIRIAEVDDPTLLERRGNSFFAVNDIRRLREAESPNVMQGYYEKGNVNPLHEMVDMMRTMQMFESQQKAIHATDETLSDAINKLGRF